MSEYDFNDGFDDGFAAEEQMQVPQAPPQYPRQYPPAANGMSPEDVARLAAMSANAAVLPAVQGLLQDAQERKAQEGQQQLADVKALLEDRHPRLGEALESGFGEFLVSNPGFLGDSNLTPDIADSVSQAFSMWQVAEERKAHRDRAAQSKALFAEIKNAGDNTKFRL